MAKFFSRLGQDKATCPVRLYIHKIEADVVQPLNCQLIFKRGPQEDKTQKFELGPFNREVTIDATFTRDSTFYKDNKTGNWAKKECIIQLAYFQFEKQFIAGSVEINMGDMVDQGEVTRWFEFSGQTNTENARVQCTFNITVGEERESTLSGVKSIVKKVNTEENRKTVAALASNVDILPASESGEGKSLGDMFNKGKDMLEQIKNLKEALADKDKAMELMKEKLAEVAKEKAMELVQEKLGDNASDIAGNLIDGAVSRLGKGAQKDAAIEKQNEEIGILLNTLNHSRKKLEEAQSVNKKLEMLVSSLQAEVS